MANVPALTSNSVIGVVGLGYVGLPLAVAFGRQFRTVGFDLSQAKVKAYREGYDPTGEVSREDLAAAHQLECTSDPAQLAAADFIVVAVPTPVDEAHQPDFSPLVGASTVVGQALKAGAVVVYESTVYPGATEEICIPVLEQYSGKRWGQDFFVGYSPERINPGDKEHTLTRIVKVVSGDSPATLEAVAALYGAVVTAGVHKASSIKVAEAAKVIENTQRDINIALMNELSLLCEAMDIDTLEVLAAAGTKWNFLPFRPGLVGGHCIGVDPYYLLYKAQALNIHPEIIPAGRRINDSVGTRVAKAAIKQLIRAKGRVMDGRIGILGLTFKENVPDLRNTRVVDIVAELRDFGAEVLVHDPMASPEEAQEEYGLALQPLTALHDLDALILAVAHDAYKDLSLADMAGWFRPGAKPVLIDVKGLYDREDVVAAGFATWRL